MTKRSVRAVDIKVIFASHFPLGFLLLVPGNGSRVSEVSIAEPTCLIWAHTSPRLLLVQCTRKKAKCWQPDWARDRAYEIFSSSLSPEVFALSPLLSLPPCYYDMFMDQMNSNCVRALLRPGGWVGWGEREMGGGWKRFHRSAWIIESIDHAFKSWRELIKLPLIRHRTGRYSLSAFLYGVCWKVPASLWRWRERGLCWKR